MNTTKQYDRPNCVLTIEGFNEDLAPSTDSSGDQANLISILTKAECIFTTSHQKLQGGRDFLESLARSVSSFTQEILSGLSHSQDDSQAYPKIQVSVLDESKTYLITVENESNQEIITQKVKLRTTEFYDLLDVIDQFYADSETLPDVSLELEIVSKKLRQPDEPLSQRMIPVAAGTLSLAMAAGVLFVLPTPKSGDLEPNSNPVAPEDIPAESLPTENDSKPFPE